MRIVGLAACLLLGCGTVGYRYAATTQSSAPARAPTCNFDVLTTKPDRPFTELGAIERAGNITVSVDEFKGRVRRDVCRAGGDAVLAELKGSGGYVHGTVVRYKDRVDDPNDVPPAPMSEPAAPGAPAMSAATATASSAELRSAPFAVAPLVTNVSQGEKLKVAVEPSNGWRAAMLTDGRKGYVQDASIKVEASAP